MRETPDQNGEVQIVIHEDGSAEGWCATLREFGLLNCDLKDIDGGPRRCEDCYCG